MEECRPLMNRLRCLTRSLAAPAAGSQRRKMRDAFQKRRKRVLVLCLPMFILKSLPKKRGSPSPNTLERVKRSQELRPHRSRRGRKQNNRPTQRAMRHFFESSDGRPIEKFLSDSAVLPQDSSQHRISALSFPLGSNNHVPAFWKRFIVSRASCTIRFSSVDADLL